MVKKLGAIKNALRRKPRGVTSSFNAGVGSSDRSAEGSRRFSTPISSSASSLPRESGHSDDNAGGGSDSGVAVDSTVRSSGSGGVTGRRVKRLSSSSENGKDEVVIVDDLIPAAGKTATSTRSQPSPQSKPTSAPSSSTKSTNLSNNPPRRGSSSGRITSPHPEPLPPPPRRGSSSAGISTKNFTGGIPGGMMGGPGQMDSPEIDAAYELIPLLTITDLPRGGVSVETQAVGHVQFGIPPETIKDSMKLGIAVPSVYIVPVDRFCREMGPALGVNLAEFEFPAYFNFFVQRKRCTLIVDSVDAERNIRRVFSETLLGPAQFRRGEKPLTHEEEDFAPDFPREAIPDFQKELKHFRIMPNGKELVLETLLKFCHFESAPDSSFRDNLGAPPNTKKEEANNNNGGDNGVEVQDVGTGESKVLMNGEKQPQAVEKNSINNNGTATPTKTNASCENGIKKNKAPKALTFSQIRWIGDVAKIYPSDAPEDQIAQNKTKRVEIFKMPSGTDYVLHDIDENNVIVGKARFSGNVKVSEGISVIGLDDDKKEPITEEGSLLEGSSLVSPPMAIPSFNPPSFGVTVLGNSHGFDKSGSTSGYVLWINGRGVMIDPPPYSSATLEREGIRPRTIVGIILTHCHADHDAGAFQKVLTGSPVVVITTPTIYKSFIRKYAALSSLSPALLRHSHRYKAAIIGEPLRFQGATFHFTYTLHAIPCVGFRVDWRGRSMVFTGDHFNNPPALQKLVEKGVMSAARCADLNHLPLQDTDLLLHEAGAPPIHTPLDVLLKLPKEVRQRLYVVHTSALPEGCELRVAPTGTEGTIRLDQIRRNSGYGCDAGGSGGPSKKRPSIFESNTMTNSFLRLGENALLEDVDEYAESELFNPMPNVYAHLLGEDAAERYRKPSEPPPVSLRPTSSSDAWFTLSLLSAVPFLSNLSYTSTMEVLETARVVAYCSNETVLSASRREKCLVVVWEGTCMERECMDSNSRSSFTSSNSTDDGKGKTIWYAGDWTGPRILQPEKRLSGDSSSSRTHDIVAISAEGVKVIVVDFANLHTILKNGSALYRKYHLSLSQQHSCTIPSTINQKTSMAFKNAVKKLNVIELLESNTGLRKLTAVQKRHLECLVEGPTVYTPGQRLWRAGSIVDKAFIVVAGTVAFVPKRRHGGSAGKSLTMAQHRLKQTHETKNYNAEDNVGETMRIDAVKAVRELQASVPTEGEDNSCGESDIEDAASQNDDNKNSSTANSLTNSMTNSLTETDDYVRLSRGLQRWAEHSGTETERRRRGSSSTDNSPEVSLHDLCDATLVIDDKDKKMKEIVPKESFTDSMTDIGRRPSQGTKDRFANKVLGRLYNRRAFASGLVFSRGHFLGDIEKMVEGLLSSAYSIEEQANDNYDEFNQGFGFGENDDALSMDTMTIHELEGGQHTAHTSTLAAGKDGCVVLILPKTSLIPFLDNYPGLLLSLLGTQVVV